MGAGLDMDHSKTELLEIKVRVGVIKLIFYEMVFTLSVENGKIQVYILLKRW